MHKEVAAYAVGFALMLGILIPAFTHAATITLSPTTLSAQAGRDYTVAVYVTPAAGEKIYTVKAALSYAADIITVQGFNFGATWLPLSQPGYDAMGGGTVIKTAGYPGGFAAQTLMGTLSFHADHAGTGTLSVTSGAQTLDSKNANTISGRGSVQITVQAAAPTPTADPIRTPAVATPKAVETKPKVAVAQPAPVQKQSVSEPATTSVVAVAPVELQHSQLATAAGGSAIPRSLAIGIGILAFIFGTAAGRMTRRA